MLMTGSLFCIGYAFCLAGSGLVLQANRLLQGVVSAVPQDIAYHDLPVIAPAVAVLLQANWKVTHFLPDSSRR